MKNNSIKKSVAWYAIEVYLPRDRRLSAKLVPIFADRGCHVVNVTDPYGHILGFLDRSRRFFFQVAPQLYWLSGPRSRPTTSQIIW
jgi:CBS-domain-containing membrane protein